MHKYLCSYAYDVPHYADFVVEAESEAEAQRIINAALDAGRFANVRGDECLEAYHGDRVWVQEGDPTTDDLHPTMEQLIKESEQ